MSNLVYLVKSCEGEYEDYFENIIGIFSSSELANTIAEENHKEYTESAIPKKIWEQGMNDCFTDDDEGNYKDYLGYTAAEWEQAEQVYMYSQYICTYVYEVEINKKWSLKQINKFER